MSRNSSVLVGISGGVDSSVAALLLKRQGYQVQGVTFWLWDDSGSPGSQGENAAGLDVAREVASQLDIPHYALDLSQEFHEEVVRPSLKAYMEGKTPNPCTLCNKDLRFRHLLSEADRLGLDYIATGHHVRKCCSNGKYRLLRGKDDQKDQSYFLYGLGQEELRRVKFPVGSYSKREVYEMAEDAGLQKAHSEESQDLCFVQSDDYRTTIERRFGSAIEGGEIVDTEGEVLGRHDGIPFFTIGQRRGLGLESNEARYVVSLNPEDNRVVVGDEGDLYRRGLKATHTSWVSGKPPPSGPVEIQIRYRSPAVPCRLRILRRKEAIARFKRPQRAVTPGQIAVFYDGEVTLGGGPIERPLGGSSREA